MITRTAPFFSSRVWAVDRNQSHSDIIRSWNGYPQAFAVPFRFLQQERSPAFGLYPEVSLTSAPAARDDARALLVLVAILSQKTNHQTASQDIRR
ncbi:MAG TPA: hypothetical protein VGK80_08235 [Rhodanobacteraceae bacterium]